MPQAVSQCTNCGAFARRSLHHEEEYQSSVLLERLRISNSPATDEEILHVRHNILPTVSDDIFSIDSKVASLREVIMAMEEERERLKIVQKKYNNLVSLHRSLPSEIWSEIFLCTLSDDSDFNAFDACGPMWKLSHVCQKWRNIALSLYSCWSTLDIRFPKAAQQGADVQRLETVIQRSRQEPLNISLRDDISSDNNPDSHPFIQKCFLDILLAESYRWRELHLLNWPRDLNMLFVRLHHRLPCLESVSFHYSRYQQWTKYPMVSFFKGCPRLRKLTLGGRLRFVEFPWNQITELDLSDMGGEVGDEALRTCMRLIGLCTSLESLSLPYWDLEGDESLYTPTTCSHMRKLDATSVPVIKALTIPYLREVSLHPAPYMGHYDALYLFKQLLIRSNCSSALTSLSLASVPLAASPDYTLHSILSQTHSLTFLDLEVTIGAYDDATDASDRDQIVTIMKSLEVVPTQSVTFLPLLSSLNIRVDNHNGPSEVPYFGLVGIFASTVKARWEGNNTIGLARLRTCHFAVQARHLEHHIYRDGRSFVNIFSEAERSVFNALIDDGMDLSIRVTSDLTRSVEGDKVWIR